ncbi:MAG: VOC family protein [Tumebacillaceae bacterium]
MKLIPYLSMAGQAEEAMNFYADVFGGEVVQLDRYSSQPGVQVAEEFKEKVLHGRVKIGDEFIYFSDIDRDVVSGNQISLSMEFEQEDQIDRAFDLLSQGGSVFIALAKMFWGAKYGKVTDKFGITWDLNHQLKA